MLIINLYSSYRVRHRSKLLLELHGHGRQVRVHCSQVVHPIAPWIMPWVVWSEIPKARPWGLGEFRIKNKVQNTRCRSCTLLCPVPILPPDQEPLQHGVDCVNCDVIMVACPEALKRPSSVSAVSISSLEARPDARRRPRSVSARLISSLRTLVDTVSISALASLLSSR